MAVFCGLGLGILGRAAMRILALTAGLEPGWSLGGTLEVVAFGLLLGVPFALAFWAVRPCRLAAPWPGVVAGLGLFGVLAMVPPPAARSAMAGTPVPGWVTAALFAALFVGYGIVLDLAGSARKEQP